MMPVLRDDIGRSSICGLNSRVSRSGSRLQISTGGRSVSATISGAEGWMTRKGSACQCNKRRQCLGCRSQWPARKQIHVRKGAVDSRLGRPRTTYNASQYKPQVGRPCGQTEGPELTASTYPTAKGGAFARTPRGPNAWEAA